jgi:hypothetical protein
MTTCINNRARIFQCKYTVHFNYCIQELQLSFRHPTLYHMRVAILLDHNGPILMLMLWGEKSEIELLVAVRALHWLFLLSIMDLDVLAAVNNATAKSLVMGICGHSRPSPLSETEVDETEDGEDEDKQ